MKVVLAEKPSVARDIASVLGAKSKKDGYFEGNGYAVTYAFGHLVQIAEPESMNPDWGSPWRLQQLPMIPVNWKYRVADKADAQFKVIKKLLLDPATTKVIAATDAGREGEHIFRLIYDFAGCKKSVERLWISSLTQEAIEEGFKNLKPSAKFDTIADAAAARARADWIIGLNFTRAYTAINKQLCTVGRVQTPTLALIVERQEKIDRFVPAIFFEILATFEPGFVAKYIAPTISVASEAKLPGQTLTPSQTRLTDKANAEKVLAEISQHKTGRVTKLETKETKTKSPALYDLLTLQKEANQHYGFTAQETLDLAQNLYEEHKAISYPRTESRHLSTDMVGELPQILNSLLPTLTTNDQKDAFKKQGLIAGSITPDQLRLLLSKNHVDDTKLTDHHAIIPTHKVPSASLPEKQRKVYDLIATRFLSIFLPAETRDQTELQVTVGAHLFLARGSRVKEPGWTLLQKNITSDQSSNASHNKPQESQQLPALSHGQELPIRRSQLKEGNTTPPDPYDDASLLTAMKNAGKELDDEDLAAYMKQSGLGTPATRAAIIERLIQSGYLMRQKKSLLPTEKGKALIAIVHTELKDIALTATWEQQLADMVDGKITLAVFEKKIADFLRKLLPTLSESPASLPPIAMPPDKAQSKPTFGPCPQCRQGTVRETPKGAGCSRWKEGCKFSIWREQYGKKLTDGQLRELIEKRKTKTIKGFKKKDGTCTYDARLVLTEDFRIKLDFEPAPKKR